MLDSLIGYDVGILNNPDTQDSFVGFAVGTLVDSQMVGIAYLAVGNWN